MVSDHIKPLITHIVIRQVGHLERQVCAPCYRRKETETSDQSPFIRLYGRSNLLPSRVDTSLISELGDIEKADSRTPYLVPGRQLFELGLSWTGISTDVYVATYRDISESLAGGLCCKIPNLGSVVLDGGGVGCPGHDFIVEIMQTWKSCLAAPNMSLLDAVHVVGCNHRKAIFERDQSKRISGSRGRLCIGTLFSKPTPGSHLASDLTLSLAFALRA